jgi:hypothetical protein
MSDYSFDIAKCVVFDLETYPNRWCVGFLGPGSDGHTTFKIVEDRKSLAKLLEGSPSKAGFSLGTTASDSTSL